MLEENKKKLKPFQIATKNCIFETVLYVVFAHTYGEAEDIYRKELHGLDEILSIERIKGVADVAYRKLEE